MIKLHTTLGSVTLDLNAAKAPHTVKNFLHYAESGFYDNKLFHRVIDNFMIQGGGYEAGLQLKATVDQIENEAANGLKNLRYTVAMARTSDPHSATSQFFINIADNSFLDHTAPSPQAWGYCVFGKVISGSDVVDKIAKVTTDSRNGHQDVPLEDIFIKSIETSG